MSGDATLNSCYFVYCDLHFHAGIPIFVLLSIALLSLSLYINFRKHDVGFYFIMICIDTFLYFVLACYLDGAGWTKYWKIDVGRAVQTVVRLISKTESAKRKEEEEGLFQSKYSTEFELYDWVERLPEEIKEKGVAVKIRKLTKTFRGRGKRRLIG